MKVMPGSSTSPDGARWTGLDAAGAGAGMTLGFGEYQEESVKIAQASEHVELAMSAYFMEKYVDCMMF